MKDSAALGISHQDAHDESASGSNDESVSEVSDAVQTLVAGREKRVTAGAKMAQLVAREDDDDEVNLLLAYGEDEEAEDAEFEEDEDASDDQLDSASDDEDQGPNAQGDEDLEGEKELQRQEKSARTKKRKADLLMTSQAGLRKRVKIDSEASHPRASNLSKKKDRGSWIPNELHGPSRLSSRRQTMANREVTHARLKENEIKQAKVQEQVARAKREREKYKPKEMTQAERMAEAERTERKNAKSLNRWETMERKRAEEQAAKLAALHNRKLEGPVVSWWSGVAQWFGDKLVKIGAEDATEVKRRGRKPKVDARMVVAPKNASELPSLSTSRDEARTPVPSEDVSEPSTTASLPTVCQQSSTDQITFAAPHGPGNFFLQGIHEYATLEPTTPPDIPHLPSTACLDSSQKFVSSVQQEPSTSHPPPAIEYATRNIIRLENFPSSAAQDPEFAVLFNKKTPKLTKAGRKSCAITFLQAQYRDPTTNLPYANTYAYRKLQELTKHEYAWSSMLGCYVGRAGKIARGVPEGFSATSSTTAVSA